jgi:hypothetical protein
MRPTETWFNVEDCPVNEGFEAFKRRVGVISSYYRHDPRGRVTSTTDMEQQLLMSALFSGVDEGEKLDYLLNTLSVCLSPDDTAVIACAAAVAWARVAEDTVNALNATARATASAQGAHTNSTASAAIEEAFDKAAAATQHAERLQDDHPFSFDKSALRAVLQAAVPAIVSGGYNRDVTKPLDLMVRYGLRLTPLTAMRALHMIIAPGGGVALSPLLLERILQCAGGVDLRYVNPSDDLTVVHFAVREKRPEMVEILLAHDPSAVNAENVGPRLGLTLAHCVTPHKHRAPYSEKRDGHECKALNCCEKMNDVLYRRGADAYAKDRQGIRPLLCDHGGFKVAMEMQRRHKELLHPFKQAFRVARVTPTATHTCNKPCLLKLIPEHVLRDYLYPHLVSRDAAFPCFPCKPPVRFCVVSTGSKRKRTPS